MAVLENKFKNSNEVLENLFSIGNLLGTYFKKVHLSKAKGIDRFDGNSFLDHAKPTLGTAGKKCIQGSFKFSPYLQNLRLKGAGKKPREISIATVRDRVILLQMKEMLYHFVPILRVTELANTKVHRLGKALREVNLDETEILRTDIQDFFPSIKHKEILSIIRRFSKSLRVETLFSRAIKNTTRPAGRKFGIRKNNVHGVPQGLSISSALSNLYLLKIDRIIQKKFPGRYFRYVDDILIICKKGEGEEIYNSLRKSFSSKGLKLHPLGDEKSGVFNLSSGFQYLGYSFSKDCELVITVRQPSIDKYIETLIGLFTDFKKKKDETTQRKKFMTLEVYKKVFLEKLNERITGAYSENKRYGWMFYFSEITDMNLLYKIDHTIQQQFERQKDFEDGLPKSLKSLVRTFYEVKYAKNRNFFVDYDSHVDVDRKKEFLISRGEIDPAGDFSTEYIEWVYAIVRRKNISRLKKDDSIIGGY